MKICINSIGGKIIETTQGIGMPDAHPDYYKEDEFHYSVCGFKNYEYYEVNEKGKLINLKTNRLFLSLQNL